MDKRLQDIPVPDRGELLVQYCEAANATRVLSEVLANLDKDDHLRDYVLRTGTFSLAGLLELNRRLVLETEYAALWLFSKEITLPDDNDSMDTRARVRHLLGSQALSDEEKHFIVQLEKYLAFDN